MRRTWDSWRKYYTVKGNYYVHIVDKQREYLHVNTEITFVRNVDDADLLLKVYSVSGFIQHDFTHTLEKQINHKKDSQVRYTLAVVPISDGENAYWGSPNNPSSHFLVERGKYIAALCLRTKRSFQEHKIYRDSSQRWWEFRQIFLRSIRATKLLIYLKPLALQKKN